MLYALPKGQIKCNTNYLTEEGWYSSDSRLVAIFRGASLSRSGCDTQSASQSVSQSVSLIFDKSYVYCELGALDESRGVSDGLQRHAKSCKVMQRYAKSCKVMQCHAKSCKVIQNYY